jgi:AcrR family transcriptional regulator
MTCVTESPASRTYGGISAEQRRAQRRHALVGAGLDLVGTHGHARLTVAALCTRAGLNERYFYESFSTTDDVLVAVADEIATELTDAIVAAVSQTGPDARAKARAAIGAAVTLLTDDPRKTRIVFVEPLAAPALAAHRADLGRTFAQLIASEGQEFYGAQTSLRIGAWAAFATTFLLGGLAETLTSWQRGDLAITRDELVERASEMFVAVAEYVISQP